MPVIIGGTTLTTISLVSDRRNMLTQIEDCALEIKINNAINKALKNNNSQKFAINVKSYNKMVLITGYVEKSSDIALVGKKSSSISNDIMIINQLQVRKPTNSFERSKERFLASKIKASLLRNKDVPSATINIIADQKRVFLMGRVTRLEGEKAARIAANTNGVEHVIKLFEYIDNKNK
ncbi:transport-associated protein [Candidatus Kinetoplastibacterium crithidii (ex Angomonas deanei ATCC 30255)]|nr:transport-associated protein [Candidatus Kinetoplastibacterium crithidii (ex Angomonas deanei ATCC 30255)]